MIEINEFQRLARSFYLDSNVVQLAKLLVGKYLFTSVNEVLTVGKIVETEAYSGINDKACHASKGMTKRNKVMFGECGFAYVYLCYGIHHLFNIVTNAEGQADAVLIRAIEPIYGQDTMMERRKNKRLGNGPGILTRSLGIDVGMNGTDLTGDQIWVSAKEGEEQGEVSIDRRVGVDYAGEDAFLPWRFFEKGNPHVSKGIQPMN